MIRRFAFFLAVLLAVPARAAVLAEIPPLPPPAFGVAAAPSCLGGVPSLAATQTGLIQSPSVAEGLTALRAASHEIHPEVVRIVSRINALHPELPISAGNLFIVRDQETLRLLGIPEAAAGAARIVTDGTREVPIVILVAGRGVPLDAFVEYAVHEGVHLMDDGILRVRHDQELKHFFAEGWTQKRAIAMANRVLADLGRPETAGTAYRKEIALISAFSARYGEAALDELVRTGSDAGLRRALGARWDRAAELVAEPASRERRLDALIALINAD